MYKSGSSLYAPRTMVITTIVSLLYLLVSTWLVGFKTDQIWLVAIFNVLFYASAISRKMILGFSIFIVYWIIFDYMKAFPNYWFNEVSTEQLYLLEKKFFGITINGTVMTPNEYFLAHPTVWADVMAGIFYLCWVPVPLFFAGYLFVKNRALFLEFSLCFLLVNLLGFVVYYIYPAAPPWYIQTNGFEFVAATPGNTAGLHRFDDYFDVTIFEGLYAKSSNVFAAMPSLHSSYPVIVLYYGVKAGLRYFNLLFAAIMIGIWLAAVYTSHHYVLDVLAGILCAITGVWMMQLLTKRQWFSSLLKSYLQAIS